MDLYPDSMRFVNPDPKSYKVNKILVIAGGMKNIFKNY
jgi:hypothetical protein